MRSACTPGTGCLRDEIFLTTKFCTPQGHLPADAPVSAYKTTLEESLARLNTDHVDLIHIHSCDEIDRLMSENMIQERTIGAHELLQFS